MNPDIFFVCFWYLKDKLLLKSSQQGHLLESYYILPPHKMMCTWKLRMGPDLEKFYRYNQESQVKSPWIRGSLNPKALSVQEDSGDNPTKTQTDWRDLSKYKAPPNSCWNELSRDSGLLSPEGMSSGNTVSLGAAVCKYMREKFKPQSWWSFLYRSHR